MNIISLLALIAFFVALSMRHALNRAHTYRVLGLGSCGGGIIFLLCEAICGPEGESYRGYLLPALAHLVIAFVCFMAIPRRALERVEAPLLFVAQALFGAVITTAGLPLFVGCFGALSMLLGFFALQESRRHTSDPKRQLRVHLVLLYRAISLACLLVVWGSLWGMDLTFDRLPNISGVGKWALLALIFSSMGLFPFHGWLTPFLSAPRLNLFVPVMSLELGMVVFFRIFVPLQPVLGSVTWVVAAAAAAGMVYSALLLFGEIRLKRTVSYLVMTHLSLLVLCVLSGGQEGVVGARLDGVNVLIAASGLCTILAFLNARYGIEGVLTPSGLVAQYPEMGICFLICTLSLVGFPGTMGYVTEELVLRGGLEYRIILLPIVVMAMALNSYSCFRIFARTFFGSAMYVTSPVLALSVRERVALLSIAGLLLGAGLLPEFIKVLIGVGSLAG